MVALAIFWLLGECLFFKALYFEPDQEPEWEPPTPPRKEPVPESEFVRITNDTLEWDLITIKKEHDEN
jgi:hypothetical protein